MPTSISSPHTPRSCAELPAPARCSLWLRATLSLRSAVVQRRALQNDLCHYRHQLNQRASTGMVPHGLLGRLERLIQRLATVPGTDAGEILAQRHVLRSGMQKALSFAPFAVLQEQQARWSDDRASMDSLARPDRPLLGADAGHDLLEDYTQAITLAQARQAQIRQWQLAAAAAAPGSAAREQLLQQIARCLRPLAAAQRQAVIATLKTELPELSRVVYGTILLQGFKRHQPSKAAALAHARQAGAKFGQLRHARSGQVYFYPVAASVRQRFPVIYAPQTRPKRSAEGSSKKLVGQDQHFVALAALNYDGFGQGRDDADMLPFASVSVGLVVNQYLMLARNAGTDLESLGTAGRQLSIQVFKAALADLEAMHDEQIYLGDIKPNNLAYDGKTVHFIDVDDRHNWHPARKPRFVYTRGWTTEPLIQGRNDNRRLAFQAADQYAMLQSMIATAAGSTSARARLQWITQYVWPEHQDYVKRLLAHPDRVAAEAEYRGELLPGLLSLLTI